MGSAQTCKTFVKRPTALWLKGVVCKVAADYEDYTKNVRNTVYHHSITVTETLEQLLKLLRCAQLYACL